SLLATRYSLLTIFTAHGWTFNEVRPIWQIALIKFFSKLTCKFYDKIICVSEYDYQSAIDNNIAPIKKLALIHNGIKIEEYSFLPKEEARKILGHLVSKLDTKCPVIGTIGEFTKNKGHAYLIEAAKNFPNTKFVIIGFWPEKNTYEKQKNVLLIENLPDASKYLKAFDIFILPSLKEGLPYALLEAGLAEIPIIATNVGGIPEIINPSTGSGQVGILVNPAKSKELADAIKKLIDSPELRKILAQNLYQKIISEFSFEKMLSRTLAVYQQETDTRNNPDT
ncbi:glycosyltransferase, partial [Patescibacteria group bacterium]|nr:glycosyltransferase [Patescibacteria group bacterium]